MKIKTFTFVISNCTFDYAENVRAAKYVIYRESVSRRYDDTKLYTPEEVDAVINRFIEDKDVIDIKVNTEVLHRHNNGGSDFVQRNYTIMYK